MIGLQHPEPPACWVSWGGFGLGVPLQIGSANSNQLNYLVAGISRHSLQTDCGATCMAVKIHLKFEQIKFVDTMRLLHVIWWIQYDRIVHALHQPTSTMLMIDWFSRPGRSCTAGFNNLTNCVLCMNAANGVILRMAKFFAWHTIGNFAWHYRPVCKIIGPGCTCICPIILQVSPVLLVLLLLIAASMIRWSLKVAHLWMKERKPRQKPLSVSTKIDLLFSFGMQRKEK